MGVGGQVGAGNRNKKERNPREEEGMSREGIKGLKLKKDRTTIENVDAVMCGNKLFEHR